MSILDARYHGSDAHFPVINAVDNHDNSPNAVSMLGQRRRRWANIETALG